MTNEFLRIRLAQLVRRYRVAYEIGNSSQANHYLSRIKAIIGLDDEDQFLLRLRRLSDADDSGLPYLDERVSELSIPENISEDAAIKRLNSELADKIEKLEARNLELHNLATDLANQLERIQLSQSRAPSRPTPEED